MAYIGNTVQTQGFAPAVDYFNGDGTTVTFTLSRPVASVAQLTAVIDNVIQNPSSAFTVAGNAITFTSAPLAGTNNIWVEYTSLVTTYAAISQDPSVIGDITATGGYLAEGDFGNSYIDGTIVDYVTGNARITTGPLDNMTFYHGGTASRSAMMDLYYAGGAKIYGTTALTIPVGTTGERPTGATGMIRMNSTNGAPEWYDTTTSSWVSFGDGIPYSVSYLVVAGGGGGGSDEGGGGGGGGLLTSTTSVNAGSSYTITVGAGGSGSSTPFGNRGVSGSNSVFGAITTIGGGGGGNGDSAPSDQKAGASGGSGGGGGQQNAAGGSGTSGQGYAGGSGSYTPPAYNGGGGGGAGAVGGNSNGTQAGNGGTGVASSISGSANTYAGGGGAGSRPGGTAGTGGAGGGGNGGANANGANATTNTGGGGGSSGVDGGGTGGNGGSGIVIISYAGAQRGTGGTVTTSGGNTIHTFTSSGTYTA